MLVADAPQSGGEDTGEVAAVEQTEALLVGEDGQPLVGEDGAPLPAGSRREGDRIVAPDGTVFRERGGRWIAEPRRDTAGSRSRGGQRRRISAESARGGGAHPLRRYSRQD